MPYQRDPDSEPYDSASDPYIDQNGVLKNKLGIKDPVALENAETAFSYNASQELETSPLPGKFDLDHLKKIHKHLFGDVYPWAGEIRQVDIGKGNDLFAHHIHIEKEAGKLFKQLANENHLKGLDPEKFSERAGHYLGEINALHPFREGNGRAQRAFIGQIAREAGYEIEWSNISLEEMTRGSIESFYGHSEKLSKLIQKNLSPQTDKEDPQNEIDTGRTDAGLEKLRIADPEAFEKIVSIRKTAALYAEKVTDDKTTQLRIADRATQRAMQAHQNGQQLADLTQKSQSKPNKPKDIEPER